MSEREQMWQQAMERFDSVVRESRRLFTKGTIGEQQITNPLEDLRPMLAALAAAASPAAQPQENALGQTGPENGASMLPPSAFDANKFYCDLVDGIIVRESDGDPWPLSKSEARQIVDEFLRRLAHTASPSGVQANEGLRMLSAKMHKHITELTERSNRIKGSARNRIRRHAAKFKEFADELDELAASERALPTIAPLGDEQIKYMVNRFLSWRLPENFNPDAGISFKPYFNENTAHPMKSEPTGTNLFDADQATAMIRYLVDGMPAS